MGLAERTRTTLASLAASLAATRGSQSVRSFNTIPASLSRPNSAFAHCSDSG
jgi:hypothetical protein